MIALSLSLAACVGWGVADFLGGIKSRSIPVLTVMLIANLFGFILILAVVTIRAEAMPHDPVLLMAVIGGIAGIVALGLLYRGLAVGSMSIVAPISATGVILPVLAGFLFGDVLTCLQSIGIVAAILGSILAATERDKGSGSRRMSKGVGLAAGAAVAVGVFFIVMDQASEADPYWATLIMRFSYGVFLLPIVIKTGAPIKTGRIHLPAIMALGIVDAFASLSFSMASTMGMLSLVSVVAALYPAVTALLSTLLLGERPHLSQCFGIILALSGVVLISTG